MATPAEIDAKMSELRETFFTLKNLQRQKTKLEQELVEADVDLQATVSAIASAQATLQIVRGELKAML